MSVPFKPRAYQKRMISAQDKLIAEPKAMRGTILAATGAGKTEVFIDLIVKLFKRNADARVLIAHPRIALSQDQQKRLASRLSHFSVEFTSFHSGHQRCHTLSDRKNVSTTSRTELEEIQNETTGPHITFTSYKSLHKIADMAFDLIICDEAHYLVQPDLRGILHQFQSKVLFYTGTPIKAAAQEESMDNVDLFGDVIAEVPPSELIPLGYIVPPHLRTLDVINAKRGNTYDYPTIIAEAYKDQRSLTHKKFNHKMLVAMPSTQMFDDVMQELLTIRTVSGAVDLDFYYVTADRAVKNGVEQADRETALTDFDKNTNPSIIMHCDTLAEGIDVDGLGGVLIMRGLGMVKAIQTIGRGCRAAKADIKKSDGEIRKKRIKTKCIVTLVTVDGDFCFDIRIAEWAEMLRVAGYGDIWDFYDPEIDKRSLGGEIGEADEVEFDQIQDLRIQDGIAALRAKLNKFMEKENA